MLHQVDIPACVDEPDRIPYFPGFQLNFVQLTPFLHQLGHIRHCPVKGHDRHLCLRINQLSGIDGDIALETAGPGYEGRYGNSNENIGEFRCNFCQGVHDNKGKHRHEKCGPVHKMVGSLAYPENSFVVMCGLVHLNAEYFR